MMTQLERLIYRLVQVVEDSRDEIITVVAVVDAKGVLVAWQVTEKKAEGLQTSETVVK